jgi:hypothetical protein
MSSFISFWTLIFGQSRGFNLAYILPTIFRILGGSVTHSNLTKNMSKYLFIYLLF